MPIVFIISADWALRAPLRAELLEAGLDARGLESVDDLAGAIAGGRVPSAVVVDTAAVDATPSARTAMSHMARRVPVVVVGSRMAISGERSAPLEGAAAVMYRPVRIGEIVARVQQILAGQAA